MSMTPPGGVGGSGLGANIGSNLFGFTNNSSSNNSSSSSASSTTGGGQQGDNVGNGTPRPDRVPTPNSETHRVWTPPGFSLPFLVLLSTLNTAVQTTLSTAVPHVINFHVKIIILKSIN